MKKLFFLLTVGALTAAMPALAGDDKMKKADTDGDGTVTKAEYDAEADRCFAEMDKDGDGSLSAGEIAAKEKMHKSGTESRQGAPHPNQEHGDQEKENDAEGTPNVGGTEKNQVGGKPAAQNRGDSANTGSNERENKTE